MQKFLITLLHFCILITLLGCNPEEVENPTSESATILIRIDISPAPVKTRGTSQLILAKGNQQEFIATGHFSDGSSKVLSNLNLSAWRSDNEEIGFFSKSGVLSTGNTTGHVTVEAFKDGITSNTVDVEVTNAVITAITVTPSQFSVANGQTQPLLATATYSDGTSADVSNSVTWTSNDPQTATVTPTGLLSGNAVADTTVEAFKDGVTSNTVDVEVTNAVITAITVTPSQFSVANGQTQPLLATATYSDGTSADVSNSVTWTSNDPQAATVTPTGLLSGNAVANTTVEAFKDGVTSNTVGVDVTNAVITAITVTPSQLSVANGQTQPLLATATYSDGTSADVSSSVTWTSNDPQTATVTPTGLLSGNAVADTTVEAFKDGITSNTVDVEVTNAVITAITVTPSQFSVANGQTQPLLATATYSDGTSADVSNSVTWTSNDPQTATVTPTGLLSGNAVADTTVEAFKDGITSNTVDVEVTNAVITAITVTPSQFSVANGQTQPLLATATYSDGTSADVSNSVTWTSNDPQTATVTPTGLLSGNAVADTTVEAFKDGITSNTVDVEVTNAVITAITVTPSQFSVANGQTQPLLATATYSDGTSADVSNSVTWTSNDPQTATVTPTGLLSGNAVADTTVEAFKDGITSNTVDVEVTNAVITAITVTPSQFSVANGQTQPLLATATYSDGTSADVSNSVTWTSNDPQTATVTPTGLLSGNAVADTTVEAFKDGVTSNTVDVEVTNAVITAITVTPSQFSVANGQTQPLLATATYSDGTSADVSNSVTWTSNDPQAATVTPTGLLSGNAVANTTVEAFKDGVTSNTVGVDVTNAVITAITVTPSQLSVANGQTQPLLATATYSDGTSADVSSSVTWTSNDPQTATVTPTGLLSGNAVADTTVEAFKDGVTSNTVDVEVTAYTCGWTRGQCVDLFDTGSGTLFTNSPSKTFLDSIGGSANDGFTQEIGTSGPTGDFHLFYWNNANLLCDTYNTNNIAGRTNWRLPSLNELRGLFNAHGNMFTARNWAVRINYWTSTAHGPGYYNISLINGNFGSTMPRDGDNYVSCISVP
ncbi:Ig-like domain-containing protein (plasmid) [Vibrio chagasii]|uniref:Ig-like domain-containing protein n=1 Tax=Vibrio chagasii TaxID=170679 RepID=UPI003DA893CD